ncbi:hypothetical protein [Flaviaesturariibacter amylovorans]|uniref:Fibronectin type-III domain-containing protein n=1 Tax=Flaviaesturariibacter amylovorans TaxID=1084520 RepID=A0ABP8HMV0_9BACT
MKKFVFLLLIIQCVTFAVFGQGPDGPGLYLRSAASPKGNYIFLTSAPNPAALRPDLMGGTDRFEIRRMVYDSTLRERKETDLKPVGTVRKATTLKELQAVYTPSDLADLRRVLSVPSDEAVAEYFRTHSRPRDFSLAYNMIETKQALGEVFLDQDVQADVVYIYTVSRVTHAGLTEYIGYAIVQGKSGNYTLPYFRPRSSGVNTSDSLVRVTWKMAVPGDAVSRIPVPRSRMASDKEGAILKVPFPPSATRVRVVEELEGKFVEVMRLAPVLNRTGDTVTYTYSRKTLPEGQVRAYLLTEDEVYNTGVPSDTITAWAVTPKTIPLIYGIRVSDIEGGVRLAWDLLPKKPYIYGVLLCRRAGSDARVGADTLAMLTPADTTYSDLKMKAGIHYTYEVRALYGQANLAQKIPATGTGTVSVFARPLPPFNLVPAKAGRNIRLDWEAVDDPGFYGYYVYRGTSPRHLDLVAGPLKNKSYLDTSASLSGRSTYFYAVVNQNLRQDTSDFSETVSIVPDRVVETDRPEQVQFFYSNGLLRVSWKDVRQRDNAIAAYLVQRRLKGEAGFRTITPKPITVAYIEDTVLRTSNAVQYRVAAVNFRGDVGAWSELAEFTPLKRAVATVSLFYVRNVSTGIQVSWPEMVVAGRKGYTIYRREASEKEFTRLASVDAGTFSYLDTKAAAGKVYVYALTITEADGREGERGASLSVRRAAKP